MRILHTSDWHLGREFGPAPMLPYQIEFLDWLVKVCIDEHIDLVAVAGDLYDRAIPPTDAIELFERTVQRLCASGVQVAAITGNHDSPVRVSVYNTLLNPHLHLEGGYHRYGQVSTLQFADGPLDLVLLPYLDPQSAADDYPTVDEPTPPTDPASSDELRAARRRRRTHESVLRTAAQEARNNLRSPRSLALAHAYVAGGTTSDSERELTIGGTSVVAAEVFDGFSYTALGHLHRPQAITDRVRYSGTPLAYSFSEDHAKSITIIDMATNGAFTLTEMPIPVGRAVATVKGTLHELLTNPEFAAHADKFVRAELTEIAVDARVQLEPRFAHLLQVVPVRLEAATAAAITGPTDARPPLELALDFWRASFPEGAGPEVVEALAEAFNNELRRQVTR